jgi:hypothetical protein
MKAQGRHNLQSWLLMPAVIFFTALGTGMVAGAAQADDSSDTYLVSSDYLFVPKGFDDNDNVQVVLDGWVNSSCDQVQKPKVAVHPDQGVIEVEVKAVRQELLCMPVLTRFTAVADLGVLPHGSWQVVTNNGWLVNELVVAEAASGGPDDHAYAQVNEVYVDYAPDERAERDSKWSAVLIGVLRTSCEHMDYVKVIDSGSTVEILPVLKVEGEICIPVETPFEQRVFLPDIQQEGRYLLHVRTSDGQAINEVFSAFEQ